MTQQIHTKLHKLVELAKDGFVFMRAPPTDGNAEPIRLFGQKWCNWEEVEEVLTKLMRLAQHYVLTPEVIKLIDSDAGVESMMALHKCGIHNMPFPNVLIEQPLSMGKIAPDSEATYYGDIRQFALLMERPEPLKTDVDVFGIIAYLHGDLGIELPPFVSKLKLHEKYIDADGKEDIASHLTLTQAPWITDDPGKQFHNLSVFNNMAIDIGHAWMDAVLLLHTKGIGKEVIAAPHKLNKARGKAGKPSIPTHTVIRIGKVYDRSGQEVKHTGHSGRHRRVHWRAGHARNQAWGPGLKDHRLIYIEPVLVNYDPGTGVKPKNIPHFVKVAGGKHD